MFDAFFDGSGNSASPDETWLVLGCVSGRRDTCQRVRGYWEALLERFGVDSLHMRRASHQGDSTQGLGRERFEALVQGAIGILTEATFGPPERGLLATAHAIRMDHFREMATTVRTRPEELLAFRSLNDIYEWHRANVRLASADTPPRFTPGIRLVFDRGENFRGHLVADWTNSRHREHHRRWKLVEAIDEAAARDEPMLQAADVLAWRFRRVLMLGAGEWPGGLARDLFTTARVRKQIFQGDDVRFAARSLSGQRERYRKGSRA